MVANARRFAPARDESWVLVLRLLQDKVSTDERRLMLVTLNACAETPRRGFELLAPLAGQTSFDDWAAYVAFLHDAVYEERDLIALDWARVLLLTEMGYTSSLVGFAPLFRGADAYGIVTLRHCKRR